MKNIVLWSKWSITTKILIIFLSLLVVSMGVICSLAIIKIRDLGSFAKESSSSLGESAISDSTAHLNKLGEEMIKQKAQDIALQVNMYLINHPRMSFYEMRIDTDFRQLVVQQVGIQGYTTLIDSADYIIVIHKYQERETNISSLKEYLPSFWQLLVKSANNQPTSGYYDWQEVDGSVTQKFAAIVPVYYYDEQLTLWATTYMEDFTLPADDTKREINTAIETSSIHINNVVNEIQNTFAVIVTALVMCVIALALIWSRIITKPLMALQQGAEEIGKGHLNYQLKVRSEDELGKLARSFNQMSAALQRYTDELKTTAAENITKEKQIQSNLRIYARMISQAQEAERKRIARELHDETAQALVVVSRNLEDLANGKGNRSASQIREDVRKILEGVRHFSQELRPSILDDLGLNPAVKWLASNLTQNYGIPVDTQITGNQHQLDPQTELMLFRVTQEALNNVRKHARASWVVIRIDYRETTLKLSIVDDGVGFISPEKLADLAGKGKLGLLGMQERVELLGGRFTIASEPGKGTSLIIEVPYN
jgi:two-component system, NarL family, sensor histidine kinase DegS